MKPYHRKRSSFQVDPFHQLRSQVLIRTRHKDPSEAAVLKVLTDLRQPIYAVNSSDRLMKECIVRTTRNKRAYIHARQNVGHIFIIHLREDSIMVVLDFLSQKPMHRILLNPFLEGPSTPPMLRIMPPDRGLGIEGGGGVKTAPRCVSLYAAQSFPSFPLYTLCVADKMRITPAPCTKYAQQSNMQKKIERVYR